MDMKSFPALQAAARLWQKAHWTDADSRSHTPAVRKLRLLSPRRAAQIHPNSEVASPKALSSFANIAMSVGFLCAAAGDDHFVVIARCLASQNVLPQSAIERAVSAVAVATTSALGPCRTDLRNCADELASKFLAPSGLWGFVQEKGSAQKTLRAPARSLFPMPLFFRRDQRLAE